jgi:hypothetical protein
MTDIFMMTISLVGWKKIRNYPALTLRKISYGKKNSGVIPEESFCKPSRRVGIKFEKDASCMTCCLGAIAISR